MYKKTIIAYVLLIAVSNIRATQVPAEQGFQTNSGYAAEQGYQVEQHHHRHPHHHDNHHSGLTREEQVAYENYQKDIENLQKQGENPYLKSNICWCAIGAGAVIFVASLAAENKPGKWLGGGLVAVGTPLGVYTRLSESHKVEQIEERIRNCRDRQDKILERARHHHHHT